MGSRIGLLCWVSLIVLLVSAGIPILIRQTPSAVLLEAAIQDVIAIPILLLSVAVILLNCPIIAVNKMADPFHQPIPGVSLILNHAIRQIQILA
jgi:hypothetical protein